jgi:hypothetical protein
MALHLVREDAPVFADHVERHLQSARFSHTFADSLSRCAKHFAAAAPSGCATSGTRTPWPC